jgi:hypothetical protein
MTEVSPETVEHIQDLVDERKKLYVLIRQHWVDLNNDTPCMGTVAALANMCCAYPPEQVFLALEKARAAHHGEHFIMSDMHIRFSMAD